MRRWDRLTDRYLEEYAARGVAAATLDMEGRELARWGNWLKRRRPRPRLEQVDTELLVRYIQGRAAFRSKATVRQTMSVMRRMGEYLAREGLWPSNPLRWMRGPKVRPDDQVPRRIGRAALRQLLEAAATVRQGYHRHLWLTVLAILYGTGIRRGELVRLNLTDWERQTGLLRVDGRKTGYQRQVPIPPLTGRCLEAYLPQRHNFLERLGQGDQPALFVNRWGDRLQGRAVHRAVKVLAQRCGVPHVTLHQFRHTCASDLLADGVHLPEVQQLLGHQTITTTVRYLHVADPQRHAAVRHHPINAMLLGGGE